jgi:stage III sporulation protein AD
MLRAYSSFIKKCNLEMDMEILQIVGIGIIAATLSIVLKQQKPEIALYISIATGIILLLLVVSKLTAVVNILERMARQANLDAMYLSTILKVIGIAYIAEFGAQICKDAGEGSIASKIELGGKIIILALTVPILAALMEVILQIIP